MKYLIATIVFIFVLFKAHAADINPSFPILKDVTGAGVTADSCSVGTLPGSLNGILAFDTKDSSSGLMVVSTATTIGSTKARDSNVVQTVPPLDLTTTGSMNAVCSTPTSCPANSTVTLNIHGVGSAEFVLSGTWSATVVAEGSLDGFNTISNLNIVQTTGLISAAGVTTNGNWRILVASNFTQIRLRVSAYTSGTINATFNASQAISTAYVFQLNPGNLTTSINGLSQTTQPTAIAGGSYATQTLDPYARMPFITEESIDSRWGIMFGSTTGIISAGSTAETALALLVNPNGSGKNIRISKLFLNSPSAANNFNNYICYMDPTITSNGTALGIVGKRQTNQNAAIANAFKLPTASANGTPFFSLVVAYGSTTYVDVGFTQWLEPNHKILCTVDQSQTAGVSGISIEWVEE